MKKRTSIAVLLTCHNRKDKTHKCLSQLFENKSSNFILKVYLVDDKCTDGTVEIINEFFPQVNVIKSDGDLYWNLGMHLAWKIASKNDYDSYLWLNDDTYLNDDAINNLYEAHLKKDKSIIVGTLLNDLKDDDYLISYGGRMLNKRDNIITPDQNNLKICDLFNGNCVLIPKYVFKKIGNLDDYFHHSYGDFEYGLRAKNNNIESYIVPNFVGYCKKDIVDGNFKFLSRKYNLIQRLKFLYSPLGKNPYEAFYISRKYNSFIYSFLVFLKLHYNVIFKLKD